MRGSNRFLVAALLASMVAHLAALFGVPQVEIGSSSGDPVASPPIEARIVPSPPAPAPAVVAPSRPSLPGRTVKPRSSRAPLPIAQDAVVPQYDHLEGPFETVAAGASEAPPESADAAPEASASPADTEAIPPEYPLRYATLVFDLYYGAQPSKVGQVTHTWMHDGHRYQVETVAEAVGFVSWFLGGRLVQRANGVFAAEGLVPTAYEAEMGTRERTETARFDWPARKIALASRGETRLVDLPVGAQDPLSMLHQLYFMTPLPAAAQLAIVTGRKLYRHVYRTVGEAQFETPIGIVRALHLRREDPDGATMDVWLDLDRELLPARIHMVDRKGRVLDQVIREMRLATVEGARE
jgi:hypothetical protein